MTRSMVLVLLAAAAATPAVAADVGVSVSVGQPGFYGRIDIGNAPPPQLIYPQPVLIAPPPPTVVVQEPVYLHVPPGHARNWRRYCARYNACGQRVYFVQDNWYNKVYVPAYREHGPHGDHEDHGDRGPGDRGRGHDEERGHGRGHGDDHGRDH